jgi:hypothetical protein
MDFKTETQLRQEIADAWRLVDQHKRTAEIYAAERDHAKACYDRGVRILTGIHALLYPPRFTDNDGRTWQFKSPLAEEQMQELSDRIRSLPDEIAATDEAMKETPNAEITGRTLAQNEADGA